MKGAFYGRSSVILGALAAGVSVVIVLGSLLLAFTEGGQSSEIASFPTIESVDIHTPSPQETTPPPNTPTATNTATREPTRTPTPTATLSPTAVACNPPQGWQPYIVQRNDTLNQLAQSAGLSPQELADANCLTESRLVPDSTLYLPPTPPTSTPIKCSPPADWVIYTVQPGDTLYSIAIRVNLSISQLRSANCLTSDTLQSGQKLYVPFYPPQLPTPTSVPPTEAPPPPPTNTPVPPPTATSPPPVIPTDSNVARHTPTPSP